MTLAAEEALATAATLLAAGTGDADGPQETRTAQTLGEGLAELPDANLALVSTPGTYATAEALRALKHGLNVFLFSDNVAIEDEIELKALAERKGLLVMGPDCGTRSSAACRSASRMSFGVARSGSSPHPARACSR